jgi:hypothetical protein
MTQPGLIPDDRRPVLQPPRFGLLSLLVAIAILSALFAISHYFGTYGAAIAILFVLCVVAHVVGNALGTKLRDFGDRPVQPDGSPTRPLQVPRKLTAADFAPLTRLRERYSLGRRIFVITTAGAVIGGLVGYLCVVWLADDQTGWHVFGLGAVACAVLAGIWTFAAASFLQVTLGEFLHARRNSR